MLGGEFHAAGVEELDKGGARRFEPPARFPLFAADVLTGFAANRFPLLATDLLPLLATDLLPFLATDVDPYEHQILDERQIGFGALHGLYHSIVPPSGRGQHQR